MVVANINSLCFRILQNIVLLKAGFIYSLKQAGWILMHFTLLLFHLIKMSLAHDKHNDENWWLDMQTLTHSNTLLCHQPGKFQAKTFLTISNKGIAFQGGNHTWGWQLGERLERREWILMTWNSPEDKYQKIPTKNTNTIEPKYSWNSKGLKKKGRS